jgi:catechol 2,3-dioxygenase-like lactoylglutathione lyase family enzyme
MLRGVDHVYYWTADMDRAVAFYSEVLGLPLVRRSGDAWAEFDAGPIRVALHGVHEGEAAPTGGATAVFEVDDLDEAMAFLNGKSVAFDQHIGEVEGFARFASFLDPDGNTLPADRVPGRRVTGRRVAVVGPA